MKFSSTFRSSQLIHKLCQIFEKVHKMALLHLNNNVLTFIIRGEIGQEPQVWIQIRMDKVFSEFLVQSKYQDQVYLELDSSHWVKSLKESILGINTTLKVTKARSGQTILKMTIDEKGSKPGKFSTVIHDIPVRVLSNRQFSHIYQPTMEESTISVAMPTLISLRHVIERLKTLGEIITIKASWNGYFSIEMHSEKCDIITTYPIQPSQFLTQFVNELNLPKTEIERQSIISTAVDIKHFSQLLECYQLNPRGVILSYSQNSSILAKVYLNEDEVESGKVELDYFLPYKFY